MKQPLVSIFDKKTGLYEQVFAVRHVGEAIREFEILKKNLETKYGKNPEDFDLYQLGIYDYTTGDVENLKPSLHLVSGV